MKINRAYNPNNLTGAVCYRIRINQSCLREHGNPIHICGGGRRPKIIEEYEHDNYFKVRCTK